MYTASDIDNLRKGDIVLFTNLYNRYFAGIEHFAFGYLKNHSEAKDIAQNVFMLLWEQRNQLKDDTNLVNYLLTLAKYQCIDQIRKLQIRNKYLEDSLERNQLLMEKYALESLDELQFEGKELSGIIKKLITELPDNCREVFIMSRFKKLKYKEIAVELDISVKSVEKKMSIALDILRKEILKYNLLIMCYLYFYFKMFLK